MLKYVLASFCLCIAAPVFAHDGPLLSLEHADYWGLWLMAVGILLATAASLGALAGKGRSEKRVEDANLQVNAAERPELSLVYSRDV